jgi:branched-chain amino acid transport system substrate-binding protein
MPKLRRRRLLQAAGLGAVAAASGRITVGRTLEPIRLGLVTPLSGSQQDIGNYVKWGGEIAVAQINADGGIAGRQVVLEERDDKVTPAVATTVSRELLGLGVNLQFGGIGSGPTLALGPLMEQENGVHLTCGAGSDKINHQNYSAHIFRPGIDPVMPGHALALLAAQQFPTVLKWGGIIPDAEFGRTTWAVFVDGLLTYYPKITGKTPELLDPVLTPYGGTDMRSQINAAMRMNVDGLFNSVYGGDAVTLMQQARPFGLFTRPKCFIDVANDLIVAQALKSQTPPYWTGVHWNHIAMQDNAMSQRLYKDFVAKVPGQEPLGWLGEGHNAVYAYKAAIEKAKSTESAPVIAALKGLTWDSVTGQCTMRAEDNQAICPLILLRIEPQEAAPGYKIAATKIIPGADVIEPASPGAAMKLKSA